MQRLVSVADEMDQPDQIIGSNFIRQAGGWRQGLGQQPDLREGIDGVSLFDGRPIC